MRADNSTATAWLRVALASLCSTICASCTSGDSLMGATAFAADKTESTTEAVAEPLALVSPALGEGAGEARELPSTPTSKQDPRSTLPTAAQWAASEPSYRDVLREDRPLEGAVSVGTTVAGRIRGQSAQIPEDGEHLAALEMCKARETNFGTEELVALLADTAHAVAAELPGARVLFCNLSKERGRNLPWSHSHNSGRDADLPFFSLTKGQPVEPTVMMNFRGDLTTGANENVTFDVPRNWALVKHLLSHPTVQVQWIFVYRHLRKALLRYAREAGEPEAVIERAEMVLTQPADSSPHRDHFHVRIYCGGVDAAEGCLNDGPLWPWIEERWTEPLSRRAAALCPGLSDPDVEVRTAVLDHVEKIRGFDVAPAVAGMAILDPRSNLRLRATDMLAEWQAREHDAVFAIEDFIRAPGGGFSQGDLEFERAPEPRPAESGYHAVYNFGGVDERTELLVKRAYDLLGKMGSGEAAPFLAVALTSKRTLDDEGHTPEARLAAKAAQHVMDLRLVPALLDTLEHPDGRVRQAAAVALQRITNHRLGAAWGDAAQPERLAQNAQQWRDWWTENSALSRGDLLVRGFRLSGVPVKHLAQEDIVDVLLKATDRPTEVGYNADRVLSELTGHWSPRAVSPASKHARWQQFRNRQKGPIKLRRVNEDEVATFDRHGLNVRRFSWQ